MINDYAKAEEVNGLYRVVLQHVKELTQGLNSSMECREDRLWRVTAACMINKCNLEASAT